MMMFFFSTTSRPLTQDQPVWSPNCSSDEEDDESIQQRLIIDTDCEEQPITFKNEILEQIQNDLTATPGVSVLPTCSLTDQVDDPTDNELIDDRISNCDWTGFKLVGDNVDKNVRQSFQRIDRMTRSLHYFHSYAVLDRIDLSGLSDHQEVKEIDAYTLLPNSEDLKIMKNAFEVLVSR